MVRPHSGPSHSRQRSFSDSSHTEHHGGRMGPSSRGFRGPSSRGFRGPSSRGFRGPPGKAPPSWRESNSGGPSSYPRRLPMMGEPRERPHGHWTPSKKDNYRPYPVSRDFQQGRRRPSMSPPNRPPPVQHGRLSPHSPSHGPPNHHRPFHGNNSGRVSPSRYFRSSPSDRRGPSPHSTFRAPPRFPSPAHEQERSWGPKRYLNTRERPFGRPARGGHRWNGPGSFPKPNGGPRHSGSPQRKPREFQERSSYPERWSTERDPRKHHGEAGRGRERPGHNAPEWARHEGAKPHPRPPYRPSSWKTGPSSFSQSSSRFPPPLRPQERPIMRPLKRRGLETGRPPSPSAEYGPPKRVRRDLPLRPLPLKPFGGRGLSLKDKSRLLSRRKFREESVARLKMPPPRISGKIQKIKVQRTSKDVEEESSKAPPCKVLLKKSVKRLAPGKSDASSKSASDSDSQVESRRSVRARSSSPLDRQLTRDLVVVSHWEAGTTRSSSPKSSTSWRGRVSSKNDGDLSERFVNSQRDLKLRRSGEGPVRSFRRPPPFLKAGFRSSRPTPVIKRGPDGVFRRPLMASIIPRPPQQKPVLRKSQSIMTKYRNLQTRHKAPPPTRQATSYRRW